MKKSETISAEIVSKIKPFRYFEQYLRHGYYPYFLEGVDDYYSRLAESLNMIVEVELPLLRGLEPAYTARIKKLSPTTSYQARTKSCSPNKATFSSIRNTP